MAQFSSKNKASRVARRWWTDLDVNMTLHPNSKDLVLKYDINAIKRSVKNLLSTNLYERPFKPSLGVNLRGMLFELITPINAVIIARQIEDVIENFEPRARLVGVRANPDYDRNSYDVSVEFYIVNAPTELVELSLILERLR